MSPWSRLFVIPCSTLFPEGRTHLPPQWLKVKNMCIPASLAARLAQLQSRGSSEEICWKKVPSQAGHERIKSSLYFWTWVGKGVMSGTVVAMWRPGGKSPKEESWGLLIRKRERTQVLMSSWFHWNTQSWNDWLLDVSRWEGLRAWAIDSDCPALNRACELSCIWSWDPVDCSAPLSMEFSKQEYWGELPFLLQGIFPTQRLNLSLLYSALADRFFTTAPPGKPLIVLNILFI